MRTMRLNCLKMFTIFSWRATISCSFDDCTGSRVKKNTDIQAIAWNGREAAEMGLFWCQSQWMNSKCFSTLTLVRYSEFVQLFLVTIEPILRNEQKTEIKQFSWFMWSMLFSKNSDTRLKGHISPGIKIVDFLEDYSLFTTIAQQKNCQFTSVRISFLIRTQTSAMHGPNWPLLKVSLVSVIDVSLRCCLCYFGLLFRYKYHLYWALTSKLKCMFFLNFTRKPIA